MATMGWAVLRGAKDKGYRTSVPLECPHCSKPVEIAGRVDVDKQGPHLVLWPVAAPTGAYTQREVDYVVTGPKGETGVAMPQPAGRVEFKDDPLPRFDGSDA